MFALSLESPSKSSFSVCRCVFDRLHSVGESLISSYIASLMTSDSLTQKPLLVRRSWIANARHTSSTCGYSLMPLRSNERSGGLWGLGGTGVYQSVTLTLQIFFFALMVQQRTFGVPTIRSGQTPKENFESALAAKKQGIGCALLFRSRFLNHRC
jgi:hypothetical protein